MILEKQHANKLINIENLSQVNLPANEFSSGDTLILFNNNTSYSIIMSSVAKTYRSGFANTVTTVEFPPMCLVNAIFIDSDTVVFTRGLA
jgi:hypothetical protein